jgi:hypothetical protein
MTGERLALAGRLTRDISSRAPAKPNAPENREKHFAKRNETFRTAGGNSLKSLQALNQVFRGIVCFQGFNPRFVSPFSQSASQDPNSLRPSCRENGRWVAGL